MQFKSLCVSSTLLCICFNIQFKFKKEKQDTAKRKWAYKEIEKKISSRLMRPSGGKWEYNKCSCKDFKIIYKKGENVLSLFKPLMLHNSEGIC